MNTYFGLQTQKADNSIYPNSYFLKNSGIMVRQVDVSGAKAPASIAVIADAHIRPDVPQRLEALKRTLTAAKACNQVVLSGDNIDYGGQGGVNMDDMQKEVISNTPDIIMLMGNHECLGGEYGEVRKFLDSRWPHNPYYLTRVINNSVMLVCLDDSTSDFSPEQCKSFKEDINKAKKQGLIILLFMHIPINQIERTEGANAEMYNIIENNGDVIKALFSGHTHSDGFFYVKPHEKQLPVYMLCGNSEDDCRGNMLYINVQNK